MEIRHDVVLGIALSIALPLASIVTWAACRWWYGRQLAAAAHRFQKADKARLFSQEQTQQARRQVEQLKAELESQIRSSAEIQAARRRVAELEERRDAVEQSQASDSLLMPLVGAQGFADTQILAE